nr:uncharacterized protein LOC113724289 [Coffea arabica]
MVGNAEMTEEDWQEPVVPDEELLDKFRSGSGEGDDCLDFNPEVEFRKPHFELKVKQKFTKFRVFRSVLCEWLVREGYEVTWVKNYSKKIIVNCAKCCSWRIRATSIQDESTFQIKLPKGEHVCAREYQNKHATATYLSSKYQDKIRDNPKVDLMGLKNDIRRDLIINVSIAKVGGAKHKAKDMMLGMDMEQYQKLWSYATTVRDINAGSTIKIQIDKLPDGSTGIFQRLYYCLHACKQGFLDGCRPIIGLDGCFLKTAFGGQLLSALSRDDNDNMVSIAIAVLEVERAEYLKTYAHTITPVPSDIYWITYQEEAINPHVVRRMPGRPKKLRRRVQDEPKKGQVSTRKGLVPVDSTNMNGGKRADGTTATIKRARAPTVTDVLQKLRPKRSKA